MSLVRFVHAGALRLGSPIVGLADSPEWLRRIAASAVRQSVIQLFDAAVAAGCQFVYVAGRLTEHSEDLPLAAQWLAAQQERLRVAGVQLVLAGADAAAAASAGGLSAVVVPAGQCLQVQAELTGCHLSVVSPDRIASGALCLGADRARTLPGVICFQSPADGGPLQPLSAAESGGPGCLLCDADLQRQSLSVRPCAVEVLRFVRERLTCPDGTTPQQLLQMLNAASRSLAGSRGTTVVDWEIDGRLTAPGPGGALLCELELLRELRTGVCAGHAGAWPARIRFSDRSELSLEPGMEVLCRELTDTVQRRYLRRQAVQSACCPLQGLPLGAGSEVPETLRVLWPAA
ncbi:MAG: hypothetical protein ACK5UD_18260 [Planctomyces sp.]